MSMATMGRISERLRLRRAKDPGTGRSTDGASRVINHDGTFNVRKVGAAFNASDIYQWLIGMRWWPFLALILSSYVLLVLVFAAIYLLIGVEHLNGVTPVGLPHDLWPAVFFSSQTFTTVGYGAIAPSGVATSLLASFEAFIGLLCSALFTGLLYGRFARPSAHFRFSEKAIIAPYEGGTALMFRMANERPNLVVNMHANVLLVLLEDNGNGGRVRQYYELNLETDRIHFFPLNWTVVHPIDEKSPLSAMQPEEMARLQAEIMIQVRGYDETFAQEVSARFSYRWSEFDWGVKFKQAYHVDEDGGVVFDLALLSATEKVSPTVP